MPPTIVSRFSDPCVSQITPHNAFRAKPDSAINHPLDVYTRRLFKQHCNKNADNGNKKWCQHKTWPAFGQDENVVRIKNMKKKIITKLGRALYSATQSLQLFIPGLYWYATTRLSKSPRLSQMPWRLFGTRTSGIAVLTSLSLWWPMNHVTQ